MTDGTAVIDAPAKPKLPKGYKDEAAFLDEARKRFQEAKDADRENRDAALDDLKFLAGEQWDPKQKAKRLRQGRPCLQINVLPQFISQVAGDVRINQPGIKVLPAEDGDEDVAKVREGLIRSIEAQSRAQDVYVNAATAQAASGQGVFRVGLEYAEGDVFDQDIFIREIPNPLSSVCDPLSTDITGKDAKYWFLNDDWSKADFEKRWPDKQPTDLSTQTACEAGGWWSKDTVRVTEYWILKETDRTIALLSDNTIQDISQGVPDGLAVVRQRVAPTKSAVRYLITGHAILDGPYELPISRIPIFKVTGWEMSVGEKRVRWGLVRFAKDSNRMMNYSRSVLVETLALAPKAQWIAPQSAVEGREDDFRGSHASGDPLLVFNDKAKVAPQRVDPPAFPAALMQQAEMNSQDMKAVTGLYDASLGNRSNETSGKAIMARERQGDVATVIYPDNLHAAIAECGKVINALIPSAYSNARTIRVLGEDGGTKEQRINDPNDADAVHLSGDLAIGKYDVIVEAGPSYSTRRVEAAEGMTAFMQAFPQAAPFIGDLFAKAQDWPMAQEIGDRLKAMLPPQLQKDDQGQPVQPPPPNPQEQQAMEMQATMAQIELGTAQANQKKAEAEAAEAEANAAIAEASAMRAAGNVHYDALHGNGAHMGAEAFHKAQGNLAGAPPPPPEPPADGALEAA